MKSLYSGMGILSPKAVPSFQKHCSYSQKLLFQSVTGILRQKGVSPFNGRGAQPKNGASPARNGAHQARNDFSPLPPPPVIWWSSSGQKKCLSGQKLITSEQERQFFYQALFSSSQKWDPIRLQKLSFHLGIGSSSDQECCLICGCLMGMFRLEMAPLQSEIGVLE